MKKVLLVGYILFLICFSLKAAEINLFDWAFNVNGNFYSTGDELPGDFSGGNPSDWENGMGSVTIEFDPNAAGDYFILSFFDYEIDESMNTFFNEYGYANGTPDDNLLWEIDEPGYVSGDIYDNLLGYDPVSGIENLANGTFDNTNIFDHIPPDDVSVGLGWNFSLEENQHAEITFTVSETAPEDGFYLAHVDEECKDENGEYYTKTIYFTTELNIVTDGEPPVTVPEPGTMGLLLSGIIVLGGAHLISRRKRK